MGFLNTRLLKILAENQQLVLQLLVLRNDLSEQTVVKEVNKIAALSPLTISRVLKSCIHLGSQGKPMPWETLGENNET